MNTAWNRLVHEQREVQRHYCAEMGPNLPWPGLMALRAHFTGHSQDCGRGRPQAATRKVLLSVRYSPEVVEYFRATGEGWQARMDEVLRKYVEAKEDAEDARAIKEVMRKLAAGEEELLPAEMVHRLVEGENAILVWREHRGLTQAQLAKTVGVGQTYISMIELGQRQGTAAKLQAIARALKVQVDDLLAWHPPS